MFSWLFECISNALIWVLNQIINIASTIFDFLPFTNFIKRCINFFPPLASAAIITGLVFLTGMAAKRIFFS